MSRRHASREELEAALRQAEKAGVAESKLNAVRARLDEIAQVEANLRRLLRASTAGIVAADLQAAIVAAEEKNVGGSELRKAEQLLDKLSEASKRLRAAQRDPVDVDALTKAVEEAEDAGVATSLLDGARTKLSSIRGKLQELRNCTRARPLDLRALQDALYAAQDADIDADCAPMRDAEAALSRFKKASARLRSALEAADHDALPPLIEEADEAGVDAADVHLERARAIVDKKAARRNALEQAQKEKAQEAEHAHRELLDAQQPPVDVARLKKAILLYDEQPDKSVSKLDEAKALHAKLSELLRKLSERGFVTDPSAFRELLAAAEQAGLDIASFQAEMERVERGLRDDAEAALAEACALGGVGPLKVAIAKAYEKGVVGAQALEKAEAKLSEETIKEQVAAAHAEKHANLVSRLGELLEQKGFESREKREKLEEAIEEAKEANLVHRHLNDALGILERRETATAALETALKDAKDAESAGQPVAIPELTEKMREAERAYAPQALIVDAQTIVEAVQSKRDSLHVRFKDAAMRKRALEEWIENGFSSSDPEYLHANEEQNSAASVADAMAKESEGRIDSAKLEKAIEKATAHGVNSEAARRVLLEAKQVEGKLMAVIGGEDVEALTAAMAEAEAKLAESPKAVKMRQKAEARVEELKTIVAKLEAALEHTPPAGATKEEDVDQKDVASALGVLESALENAVRARLTDATRAVAQARELRDRWLELRTKVLNFDIDHFDISDSAFETFEPLESPEKRISNAASPSVSPSPFRAGSPDKVGKAGESYVFWFLRASVLRNCSMDKMPRMQDLRARDNADEWLVAVPFVPVKAYRGMYSAKYLAVSHRWETEDHPDNSGTQILTVKTFLEEHPSIEYVWYDYSCMPQNPRNLADDEEFMSMLPNINILYLGVRVLILQDMSYNSRFWTQFEAWLSFQKCTPWGVVSAPEAERRCEIVGVLSGGMHEKLSLLDKWANSTIAKALEILGADDIAMTNKRDKAVQLPKIQAMDTTVKEAFAADRTKYAVWLELKSQKQLRLEEAEDISKQVHEIEKVLEERERARRDLDAELATAADDDANFVDQPPRPQPEGTEQEPVDVSAQSPPGHGVPHRTPGVRVHPITGDENGGGVLVVPPPIVKRPSRLTRRSSSLRRVRVEGAEGEAGSGQPSLATAWLVGAFASKLKRLFVRSKGRADDDEIDQLVIHTDAAKALEAYAAKLMNVIAVCGPLRTGKSYLMNSLMEARVFDVSAQAASYTQGVHLSGFFQPNSRLGGDSEEPMLAFVDMEGQSDKGQSYDIKLSTPLLLISKVMILNFVCPTGPERETILQKLAIMMHAGETVSEESKRENLFGNLHIVLRDCGPDLQPLMKRLDLEAFREYVKSKPGRQERNDFPPPDAKPKVVEKYFEDNCDDEFMYDAAPSFEAVQRAMVLKQEECHAIIFDVEVVDRMDAKDVANAKLERNKVRKAVERAFESDPKTWCVPRVVLPRNKKMPDHYRKLLDLDRAGNADYVDKIDEIRHYIGEQVKEPKTLNNHKLTASMIMEMMPVLAKALAADNPALSPPTFMEAVLSSVWTKIVEEAKVTTRRVFDQIVPQLPVALDQLETTVDKRLREELERLIKYKTVNLPEGEENKAFATRFWADFNAQVNDLRARNRQRHQEAVLAQLHRIAKPINVESLAAAVDAAVEAKVPEERFADMVARLKELRDLVERLGTESKLRPMDMELMESLLKDANELEVQYYAKAMKAYEEVKAVRDRLEAGAYKRPMDVGALEEMVEAATTAGVPAIAVDAVREKLHMVRTLVGKLRELTPGAGFDLAAAKELIDASKRAGVPDADIASAESFVEHVTKAEQAMLEALHQLGSLQPGRMDNLDDKIGRAKEAGVAGAVLEGPVTALESARRAQAALQQVEAAFPSYPDAASAVADVAQEPSAFVDRLLALDAAVADAKGPSARVDSEVVSAADEALKKAREAMQNWLTTEVNKRPLELVAAEEEAEVAAAAQKIGAEDDAQGYEDDFEEDEEVAEPPKRRDVYAPLEDALNLATRAGVAQATLEHAAATLKKVRACERALADSLPQADGEEVAEAASTADGAEGGAAMVPSPRSVIVDFNVGVVEAALGAAKEAGVRKVVVDAVQRVVESHKAALKELEQAIVKPIDNARLEAACDAAHQHRVGAATIKAAEAALKDARIATKDLKKQLEPPMNAAKLAAAVETTAAATGETELLIGAREKLSALEKAMAGLEIARKPPLDVDGLTSAIGTAREAGADEEVLAQAQKELDDVQEAQAALTAAMEGDRTALLAAIQKAAPLLPQHALDAARAALAEGSSSLMKELAMSLTSGIEDYEGLRAQLDEAKGNPTIDPKLVENVSARLEATIAAEEELTALLAGPREGEDVVDANVADEEKTPTKDLSRLTEFVQHCKASTGLSEAKLKPAVDLIDAADKASKRLSEALKHPTERLKELGDALTEVGEVRGLSPTLKTRAIAMSEELASEERTLRQLADKAQELATDLSASVEAFKSALEAAATALESAQRKGASQALVGEVKEALSGIRASCQQELLNVQQGEELNLKHFGIVIARAKAAGVAAEVVQQAEVLRTKMMEVESNLYFYTSNAAAGIQASEVRQYMDEMKQRRVNRRLVAAWTSVMSALDEDIKNLTVQLELYLGKKDENEQATLNEVALKVRQCIEKVSQGYVCKTSQGDHRYRFVHESMSKLAQRVYDALKAELLANKELETINIFFARPLREIFTRLNDLCDPQLSVDNEMRSMIETLTKAAQAVSTVENRRALRRKFLGLTADCQGTRVLEFREELYDKLGEPSFIGTVISEKRLPFFESYVEMYAELLSELHETCKGLYEDVRSRVLTDEIEFFRTSFAATMKAVQAVTLPDDGVAVTVLSNATREAAASWRELYNLYLVLIAKVHNAVRDHISMDYNKVTGLNHSTITLPVLKEGSLPDLQNAPAGVPVLATMYRWMRERLKAPSHFQPTFHLSASSSTSADDIISNTLKTATVSNERNFFLDHRRQKFESVAHEALSLKWIALGHGVLSILPRLEPINWIDYLVRFVSQHRGEYKGFGDLIVASVDMQNELLLSSEANVDPLIDISQSTSLIDKSKLHVAMHCYVEYLYEIRLVKTTFLRSKYKHLVEPHLAPCLNALRKFVQLTTEKLKTDPQNFESHVDFHLKAVRAARDLCATYTHLGEQFNPEWQKAEWDFLKRMIEACVKLDVRVVWKWNPRIETLDTLHRLFRYFHKPGAKERNETSKTDAEAHFRTILKPFDNVVNTTYHTTEDLQQEIGRLKMYIEFAMAMPAIAPEEAIDLLQREMNDTKRVQAMGTGMSSEEHATLLQQHGFYEKEWFECEKEFLAEGSNVDKLLQQIHEMASSKCVMGPVETWDPTRVPQTVFSRLMGARREEAALADVVPQLLAKIAFLFSLSTSDLIEITQSGRKTRKLGALTPSRPHCIQVLGILTMLGLGKRERIRNHVAEVLTGQGKSWVLLLLSTLFAVTGKDVVILCHNASLSARDERSSQPFIRLLGTHSRHMGAITYKTYEQMGWDAMDSRGDGRTLRFASLVNGVLDISDPNGLMGTQFSSANGGKDTVLLIDEVDVIFSSMYDQSLNSITMPAFPAIGEIQIQMAQKNAELSFQEVQNITARVGTHAQKLDDVLWNSQLFRLHLGKMTTGMQSVPNTGVKYRLVKEGSVASRKIEVFVRDTDGTERWTDNTFYGYTNAFKYLQLCKQRDVPPGAVGRARYGTLDADLGQLSYAQLPTQFKAIFGVTGSLGVLAERQRQVLTGRYRVDAFSYFPSFWGKRLLKWDEANLSEDDFQVLEDEEAVFTQAKIQITKCVRGERAALVFLKDTAMLHRFKKHIMGAIADLQLLDPTDPKINENYKKEGRAGREWTKKEYIIDALAGEPKMVTLATEGYSRGEDFKYSPSVVAKGGGHAIQCFLSATKADEIQVRGRVARKNEPGSYSLLVSWGGVTEAIGSNDELKELQRADQKALKEGAARQKPTELYKEIDRIRLEEANKRFVRQADKADQLKKQHDNTMDVLNYVRGYFTKKSSRKEVLQALTKVST